MADGFDRDELLRLWKEIEELQNDISKKIPLRIMRLTHEAVRVIEDRDRARRGIEAELSQAFPGMHVVDAAVDASRMPPRADLLCPECGGECRLIRDEPVVPSAHLGNPHPYCPSCFWTGVGSQGDSVTRLGLRP